MKKLLLTAMIGVALFVAACEDPAANKAKATVAEPEGNSASNSAAEAPPVKGEGVKLDSENSKVEFTGSKVTGKHDGGFKKVSGTIDLVNRKPEDSSVFFEIDTTSVYTDDDKLTQHLSSKDFFEVEKFPKATFKSTKIVPDTSKEVDVYTVTGDFELHGVTKSITFPATIVVGDDSVFVTADFAINRKDFGIVYAGKADDLIRDDVVIRLELKAPRRK